MGRPMAREPLKNVGASVRARLLQRSRDERTDFQILLTRYALERLLYRLSRSEHRNRFVLKGAMLFVTWVEAPFRPTRDLDLLGYGDNSPQAIGDTFRAILTQPVADRRSGRGLALEATHRVDSGNTESVSMDVLYFLKERTRPAPVCADRCLAHLEPQLRGPVVSRRTSWIGNTSCTGAPIPPTLIRSTRRRAAVRTIASTG